MKKPKLKSKSKICKDKYQIFFGMTFFIYNDNKYPKTYGPNKYMNTAFLSSLYALRLQQYACEPAKQVFWTHW